LVTVHSNDANYPKVLYVYKIFGFALISSMTIQATAVFRL